MFFIFLTILPDQRDLYARFEREAIPHMDALYNYAMGMIRDHDEANDLVQETYLRAFRFFDKFEQGTNCKAWLFMILKNTYINLYRKQKREPVKLDYEDVENYYENVKASNTDSSHLEKDIYENLLNDELTEAISSLPEDFRTVIMLCDIEGFSYEEIADFIDCPVGTVRSRLHRARKLLFTKLYEYANEHGYIEKDNKLE